MIPPLGQHHLVQNHQRELAEVQSYIQARLQTDEPYLLNVNPAQVADYQDELQHYVKQKQRQHQVRRPLPISRDTTHATVPRASCPVETSSSVASRPHTPVHRMSSEYQPTAADWSSACAPSSVVPNRLPGVEWLLAHNHHQHQSYMQQQHSQVSRFDSVPPPPSKVPAVPVMLPPSYMPFVQEFGAHRAIHHRTLKKQKTM